MIDEAELDARLEAHGRRCFGSHWGTTEWHAELKVLWRDAIRHEMEDEARQKAETA